MIKHSMLNFMIRAWSIATRKKENSVIECRAEQITKELDFVEETQKVKLAMPAAGENVEKATTRCLMVKTARLSKPTPPE